MAEHPPFRSCVVWKAVWCLPGFENHLAGILPLRYRRAEVARSGGGWFAIDLLCPCQEAVGVESSGHLGQVRVNEVAERGQSVEVDGCVVRFQGREASARLNAAQFLPKPRQPVRIRPCRQVNKIDFGLVSKPGKLTVILIRIRGYSIWDGALRHSTE